MNRFWVIILEQLKGKALFSSESVTEGHPDKICDQVSDAILDDLLRQDPQSRVAVECLTTTGLLMIAGEVTTSGYCNVEQVARKALEDIGYTDPEFGLDAHDCAVLVSIHEQSKNIAVGVDSSENKEQGAGDQGMMLGFACDETPELMPLPISIAHKLTQRLAEVRKKGILKWVRPDGKSQVTVEYQDGIPKRLDAVVIAVHHSPTVDKARIKKDIWEEVVKPVCEKYLDNDTKFFVNETGIFVKGGPEADTGVTGRKIIVDTYGSMGRHGGGAFSGKDPSKVDRSGAYMARYVAKNVVASGLAKRCEVQVAYSIGVAAPVSVYVETFGTAVISQKKIAEIVQQVFDFRPARIIEHLALKRPIYKKTAAYGHFGREDPDFTWEKTDKKDELRKLAGI